MSIKSLFNTITTRTTDTIEATAKTVAGVGTWASEWSEALNSDAAKQVRHRERMMELSKRDEVALSYFDSLDVDAIKAAKEKADKVIETLYG